MRQSSRLWGGGSGGGASSRLRDGGNVVSSSGPSASSPLASGRALSRRFSSNARRQSGASSPLGVPPSPNNPSHLPALIWEHKDEISSEAGAPGERLDSLSVRDVRARSCSAAAAAALGRLSSVSARRPLRPLPFSRFNALRFTDSFTTAGMHQPGADGCDGVSDPSSPQRHGPVAGREAPTTTRQGACIDGGVGRGNKGGLVVKPLPGNLSPLARCLPQRMQSSDLASLSGTSVALYQVGGLTGPCQVGRRGGAGTQAKPEWAPSFLASGHPSHSTLL